MDTPKRLYRSSEDRMFAGVCGGIAEYLEVDPTLVRLVFVALTFLGAPGVLIYIVLMLIVPEHPPRKQKAKTAPYHETDVEQSNIPVPPGDTPAPPSNLTAPPTDAPEA